jgi:hypothetical protein
VPICAFLAPEPIPAAWFTTAAGQLPRPLTTVATNPVAWGQALGAESRDAYLGNLGWTSARLVIAACFGPAWLCSREFSRTEPLATS